MKPFRAALLASLLIAPFSQAAAPKLVLQITVDGLRGDLLQRYSANLDSGGFNYLLENGAVFTNAHYLHANTETIVGHTTLATGATPAVHGMVGNVWYHADSGELGYNIEDPNAPLLPTRASSSEGAQVDPAQQQARSKGRSPRGILAPTIADTLSISLPGDAKIFGVSGKDRSAVAMAGHSGTAYWYSTNNGDFQTSRYYMEEYPQWAEEWNKQRKAESLGGSHWQLLLQRDEYLLGEQDDRPYEIDLKGYGKTFPHAFGEKTHPLFFTRVLVSPEGDRLLTDFAKALIDAEQIGEDSVTDYLSISFSSVDAVNHFFGPSSLENEDTVLQLDRTLDDLFQYVDSRIGLENTLIVLSADHGMAEMPEYASERGYPAQRLYAHEVLAMARELAVRQFGDGTLVKEFYRPYLYLDKEALENQNLDRQTVTAKLARALTGIPGIRAAVPSAEAADYREPSVAHNHHSSRSGDIYIYPEPYWFLFEKGPIGVMHGSPWSYDQHVPVVFAGPGIAAAQISRLIHPIDVAPTLAALLNIPAPAAAQGKVLPEVVRRQDQR
jgi:predicted AlkP superfamily pyrophosphatase or phosphodiesterase